MINQFSLPVVQSGFSYLVRLNKQDTHSKHNKWNALPWGTVLLNSLVLQWQNMWSVSMNIFCSLEWFWKWVVCLLHTRSCLRHIAPFISTATCLTQEKHFALIRNSTEIPKQTNNGSVERDSLVSKVSDVLYTKSQKTHRQKKQFGNMNQTVKRKKPKKTPQKHKQLSSWKMVGAFSWH